MVPLVLCGVHGPGGISLPCVLVSPSLRCRSVVCFALGVLVLVYTLVAVVLMGCGREVVFLLVYGLVEGGY